jgi:hypothetical protein
MYMTTDRKSCIVIYKVCDPLKTFEQESELPVRFFNRNFKENS